MHLTKDIFHIVKRVVDEYDLLELLKKNAPKDEYDSESRRIAAGLRNCIDVKDVQILVYTILRDSFGNDIPEKLELYFPIANAIFNAVEDYLKK